MSDFIIGLDLGQAQDYTAIALLERVKGEREAKQTYHVRGLERPPLGTPYPAIVNRVCELMSKEVLEKDWRAWLVADATGVGPPVIDLLRQAGLRPVAITIHGGDAVTSEGLNYHVPKRDLVSIVKVVLQTDRLLIAAGLELGPTLAQELLNIRAKISLSTVHDSYEAWREGMHDDLVLAVALACWWGEQAYWGPPPNVQIRWKIRRGDSSRAERDGFYRQ